MTKSWKTNFFALLVAEMLAIIGFAISMPVVPLFLAEDIGIEDPVKLKLWVGLIQSSAAIALAVLAPIWGHLADIYSRRMMLLRAMFGGAVVVSLISLVQSPWQLLILRTIQGCLTGTVAAATVLTAGITPAAQIAFALGLLQTGIATGNTIGPLVGGLLSDFLGRRAAFLCTGLILALAGLIVLKWVQDDKQPSGTYQAGPRKIFPDIKPILASPTIVTLLIAAFTIQAANTIAEPMLPLFLRSLAENARYVGSSTGIVLGAGAASAALAAALVGKYSTGFGYWKTLILCLSAGAILTLPQTFVSNMIQLTVFRVLASFFVGGAIPVLNALIAANTDKEHQGSVYGVNSSVASAGGALGPVIGSAIAMASYRAVFLGTALMLGLSALGTLRRRHRLKREGV
jgi:DHA1 family multidrug resistance protein-like MFS transporter